MIGNSPNTAPSEPASSACPSGIEYTTTATAIATASDASAAHCAPRGRVPAAGGRMPRSLADRGGASSPTVGVTEARTYKHKRVDLDDFTDDDDAVLPSRGSLAQSAGAGERLSP